MDIQEKKNKRLIFIEIFIDLTSAIFKFIAGFLGHSSVMIAEAFHSLSDTTNQIFLLIGAYTSKKIADKDHPFGYGKEKFFWAFMSAIFILSVSSISAIREGIEKITHPKIVFDFRLSFIILGVTLFFQLINLCFSSRYFKFLYGDTKIKKGFFRKLKSVKEPTVINLFFGDIFAVIGNSLAIFALFLVKMTGNPIYDGIASIIIGLMLAYFAIFLISDVKKLLIGEAVSPMVYKKISFVIAQAREVESIVNLKTMHLSPTEILLNADLEFKDSLNTKQIEKAIDKIESNLRKKIIGLKQISIEAEPNQGFKRKKPHGEA